MQTNKMSVLLGLALLAIAAGVSSKYHDPSEAFDGKIVFPNKPRIAPKPPSIDDAMQPYFNDRLHRICELHDDIYDLGSLSFHQRRCMRDPEILKDDQSPNGTVSQEFLSRDSNSILI